MVIQTLPLIRADREFDSEPLHQIPRDLTPRICKHIFNGTKLINLVAPAGYGKTTLARQCQQLLESQGLDCRYLTLTAEHNKRADFVALLQRHSCRLEAGKQNFCRFRTQVLQQLANREKRLVLMIDGLEKIRSREILDFINGLIAFSSTAVTLVLISRETLALPFSELRMQGRLLEVGVNDIALSELEMGAVAERILGREVGVEWMAELKIKTLGWSAGVIAALQMLKASGGDISSLENFNGRDRTLVSYFREQVFEDLELELQQMLLRCCQSGCIGLAQISKRMPEVNGEYLIEVAERSGAFIIDMARDRSGFDLHPLFRDFLIYEALCRKDDSQNQSSQARGATVIYADFEPPTTTVLEAPITELVEPLTRREQQLLQLISVGDTNREVAEKLFISEQTVKWHLNKAYAKLGVKNRTTAVAKARACQVI